MQFCGPRAARWRRFAFGSIGYRTGLKTLHARQSGRPLSFIVPEAKLIPMHGPLAGNVAAFCGRRVFGYRFDPETRYLPSLGRPLSFIVPEGKADPNAALQPFSVPLAAFYSRRVSVPGRVENAPRASIRRREPRARRIRDHWMRFPGPLAGKVAALCGRRVSGTSFEPKTRHMAQPIVVLLTREELA
jgi:hypothetical protein